VGNVGGETEGGQDVEEAEGEEGVRERATTMGLMADGDLKKGGREGRRVMYGEED